jgi:hypothetical protein
MWWLDGKGRGGQDGVDGRGQTGGWPDGKGTWPDMCVWGRSEGGCQTGWGGVLDGDLWGPDGMGGCSNGKDAGDGRGGVRTKGKGETGSLDHVRMRYVGSSGASSRSSSLELSVLSSSSCLGNPLRRCKTSFLMTILFVR